MIAAKLTVCNAATCAEGKIAAARVIIVEAFMIVDSDSLYSCDRYDYSFISLLNYKVIGCWDLSFLTSYYFMHACMHSWEVLGCTINFLP